MGGRVGFIINRRTLLKRTLMERDDCHGETLEGKKKNNFYVGARLLLYWKRNVSSQSISEL